MAPEISIELRPGLAASERVQVDALAATCAAADGVDLKLAFETASPGDQVAATCALALDGDLVVGYASIDSGTTPEITGMVHPDHRRRGAGRGLLAATMRETQRRGSRSVLLIAEEESVSGQAFVGAVGWRPHSREHRMELDLAGWAPRGPIDLELTQADLPAAEDYARVAAEAFGEDPVELLQRSLRSIADPAEHSYIARLAGVGGAPGEAVGVGRLFGIGDRAGVYGFAVVPAWRSRGIGGQMLDAMLSAAVGMGYPAALLEVEPDNQPAVRLYKSRGFVVQRTYGYYSPIL